MNSQEPKQGDSSVLVTPQDSKDQNSESSKQSTPSWEIPSILTTSGISTWAKNLKVPDQLYPADSLSAMAGNPTLQRITSGFGSLLGSNSSAKDTNTDPNMPAQPSRLGSFAKGLVDSSKTAIETVQDKARQLVLENQRQYKVGGVDLDLAYIAENVIVMGFPVNDISSKILGYFEGFYRNHMGEVIKFLETRHKENYKLYNLCSERLYDTSLFEGKVACFPIDDQNCPPIQLIMSFCQSAKSWLKQDTNNVVVLHSKAGLARTGLMVSSLLLYLKIFATADESIEYYSRKRSSDTKGLVIPSQIRYVKYFERILTKFGGKIPSGRRCMLRGLRLHNCPYWVRPSITITDQNARILFSTKKHPKTKDLMPEDFWFKSKTKGIMIFALPGEPGLTELAGDFKIYFHDRQGDFYSWLNTAMVENKVTLSGSELDGFEKRKIPCPGFALDIVLIDYDGSHPSIPSSANNSKNFDSGATNDNSQRDNGMIISNSNKDDKDDFFSDSDIEDNESSIQPNAHVTDIVQVSPEDEERRSGTSSEMKETTKNNSILEETVDKNSNLTSDFKPVAADASMFSFGDDDDDVSE